MTSKCDRELDTNDKIITKYDKKKRERNGRDKYTTKIKMIYDRKK